MARQRLPVNANKHGTRGENLSEHSFNNSAFTLPFFLCLVSWRLLSRAWRSETLTLLLSLTSSHQIHMWWWLCQTLQYVSWSKDELLACFYSRRQKAGQVWLRMHLSEHSKCQTKQWKWFNSEVQGDPSHCLVLPEQQEGKVVRRWLCRRHVCLWGLGYLLSSREL